MVTLPSMAFPMAHIMLMVSSPRPPRVSATMGMKLDLWSGRPVDGW